MSLYQDLTQQEKNLFNKLDNEFLSLNNKNALRILKALIQKREVLIK